jgi:hypothetical protein
MIILLYYPKESNQLIQANDDNIIDDMYNKLAMIPTLEQLKKYKNINKIIEEVTNETLTNYIMSERDYISRLTYKLPLFDYVTKNIYLVISDEVYIKVTIFNYRFPDDKIINLLNHTIEELEVLKSQNIEWVNEYIRKIMKNLNFLSNYNMKILKETYTEVFLNTNPTSRELTTCIKPSYLPYQTYQSPYYTKSELVSLALNLGIIKDKKIKPWSFKKRDIIKICKKISTYEINTQMLIYNQLYILYNNAKAYVQYYSLFGSYYFNNY